MAQTLYDKLITIEDLNKSTCESILRLQEQNTEIMDKQYQDFIDITIKLLSKALTPAYELKRSVPQYEKNPIFKEALYGRQSITESLEELAQVNKGYKKWLPRRKDKIQNERVEQIGELISKPYGLQSNGILYPDNFVTGAIETGAFTILIVGPLCGYIVSQAATTPKGAEEIMYMSKITSYVSSPIFALGLGVGFGKERFRKLPFDQAKYLDDKIVEYKSGKV